MITSSSGRAQAASGLSASDPDYRGSRLKTMYQRTWSAQEKTRASGAFGAVFADFVSGVASPFGVHTETQSASNGELWHRGRLRDIRNLPVIGDVHRYATGECRKVLLVLFERNRLRVLTD
jgi:hypothetical protein